MSFEGEQAHATRRKSGTFIMVVGPSGAGKDTLMSGAKAVLAGDERFIFVQRVITRPPNTWEDHASVSAQEFERMRAACHFALDWQAHGLSYGIPASAAMHMRRGRVVICNTSRAVYATATATLDRVAIAYITAPRDILRERLERRGREKEVGTRLLRETSSQMRNNANIVIDNCGPIEVGVALLVDWLNGLGHSARIS